MSGTTARWTIGRDGRAVITDNGTVIQLEDVSNIQLTPQYTPITGTPLATPPVTFNAPNGWGGSFTILRKNRVFDNWVQSKEDAFWASGTLTTGTITLYIREPDGTTSRWQFLNVSYRGMPGAFENDSIVTQTLSWTASQRIKLG